MPGTKHLGCKDRYAGPSGDALKKAISLKLKKYYESPAGKADLLRRGARCREWRHEHPERCWYSDPQNEAKRRKANAKNSAAHLGKAGTGCAAKGPEHHCSKFWVLLTPDLNVVAGPNLAEIIRRNSHLFNSAQLKGFRGKPVCNVVYSRAYAGLKGLFRLNKGYLSESWYGWRACDNAEMIKDTNIPYEKLKLKPTPTAKIK